MAVVSPPITSGYDTGQSSWQRLDWLMLALVLIISIWGGFTVLSATQSHDETQASRVAVTQSRATSPDAAPGTSASGTSAAGTPVSATGEELSSHALKQALFIVVGLLLLLVLALSNYQWLMHLQFWIYVFNLGLLASVLIIGSEVNGAQSWIKLPGFSLQPAEFSKFALIICLAAFLCRRQERIREWPTLLLSLLYLAPPLLLILKQPDFGTMLAVFSIWFGMMFFGGAKGWHLAVVVVMSVLLFGAAWQMNVLKPHQKERLAVFLDQDLSPRGAGYHVRQSQIAIGGGQISGQGWGQGIQNRGNHVPENETDFIFAVVAEELGFVGGALLMFAYAFLLFRSATISLATENYFGALIAGGFTALLAFHTVVNIGMTMRVMPITGVPLPFFSYGGSSYLTFAACVGLLQSVVLHSRRSSF